MFHQAKLFKTCCLSTHYSLSHSSETLNNIDSLNTLHPRSHCPAFAYTTQLVCSFRRHDFPDHQFQALNPQMPETQSPTEASASLATLESEQSILVGRGSARVCTISSCALLDHFTRSRSDRYVEDRPTLICLMRSQVSVLYHYRILNRCFCQSFKTATDSDFS